MKPSGEALEAQRTPEPPRREQAGASARSPELGSSASSIRARLLRWLLPLLVLILGASSVLDYRRAISPVEDAYDLALANAAFAIGRRADVEA